MRKQLFVTLLLTCGLPFTSAMTALANPEPQSQSQQAVTIQGLVLDENNEPVAGATVAIEGSKTGAVSTDFDGNFGIRVKPGTKLLITYVGYKPVTMAAAQNMTVYMQPTTEVLDQLVVVGYGSQKRANLTGAVASVDVARTMDSRPVQDITRALQGAVPGLTITTSNGDITSNPTMRIRGTGTLTDGQNSNPLIVVDGVPVDDLSFLNPEDVEEISVLKDAASASIYGTRASFGVILITTKNAGTKDRVSLKYTNNFAWSSATMLPEFASLPDDLRNGIQCASVGGGDSEIFGLYYKDILPYAEKWLQQHGGKTYTEYRELMPYVDENNVGDYRILDNGTWLRYGQWDVAKTLFRTAPSNKHNVSLEGQSGKTNYRISFGYDGKGGLERYNPAKMNRYMANANISTEIFSWLKAGARFNFSDKEITTPGENRNMYQYAWRWPGFFEGYGYMYGDDGIAYSTRSAIGYRLGSPMNKTVTTQTRMQAWMEATLLKGLTLHGDFTYSLRNQNSDDSRKPFYMWNTWQSGMGKLWSPYTQASSYAAQSNYKDDMWTMNIFATYAKTFNENHNLKVMVGATAERESYNYFYAKRDGLVDYNLPNLNLTYTDKYSTSAERWHRATAGFFGRINYDYKGIYLLEVNGRYDGSSRFPAADQWAFFPSFSAGYRFSEEGYFAPLKEIVSNGKVRASYGSVGNEAVGQYRFLSTVSQIATSSVHWLNGSQKITEFGMPTLVSSSLKWERIETADVGLDLGFLNNMITFSFDWYQRYTKDMLAPAKEMPAILGASSPYTNAGQLRTRGWELSLGFNKSFGDADVYATFNLSDARSKITSWPSDNDFIYTYYPASQGYTAGTYYGDIWGFETDRYFTEADFVGKNADGSWQYAPGVADQTYLETGSFVYGPGDIKFKDLNNDGKIDGGDGTLKNPGDLKVIGNALPRYEYSFRLGGAWKNFDIDLFFQGVGKRNMWTTGSIVIPNSQSSLGIFSHQTNTNQYVFDDNGNLTGYVIDQDNDYPTPFAGSNGTGTIANIGRGQYNYYPQSRYLLNMAYLRFKNLTLGYTLPVDITRKAYIQRARVYFSAENLFFLYNGARKYKIDPELTQGYASAMGVDDGYAGFGRTTPMMRTFSFGIQVTF